MDNLSFCPVCEQNGCSEHALIGRAPRNDHGCGGSYVIIFLDSPEGRTGKVVAASFCSLCGYPLTEQERWVGFHVLLPNGWTWETAGKVQPIASFSHAWETAVGLDELTTLTEAQFDRALVEGMSEAILDTLHKASRSRLN